MGNISLGYSSAHDAAGNLHEFAPGDELPEWVTAKRKDSNALTVEVATDSAEAASEIIARAQAEALAIVEAAKAEAEQIRKDVEPADVDVNDENSEAEESGEPDFTKPATPKRGRPSKTQA